MNSIILLALEAEAPQIFKKYKNVFHIGVGKVNAAVNSSYLIKQYNPRIVVNFGTAGGITVDHGGIFKCTKFSQRDLHVSGCVVGQDLIDLMRPIEIGSDGLHLSTGDNFVTDPEDAKGADLVDMEGFALAKVCVKNQVNFLCYKFVSDRANEDAKEHFLVNINFGEKHFLEIIENLQLGIIA